MLEGEREFTVSCYGLWGGLIRQFETKRQEEAVIRYNEYMELSYVHMVDMRARAFARREVNKNGLLTELVLESAILARWFREDPEYTLAQ